MIKINHRFNLCCCIHTGAFILIACVHKVIEFKFCLNSNSFVLFELVCFSKKEKERKIRAKERNPTQIPQAGLFLSLKPVGRPTLCLLSFLPVRPSKQPSRPASSLPRAWPKRARSAQPSVSALRASPPPSDKAGPLNSVRAPEPAPSLSARVRARPLTGGSHLSAPLSPVVRPRTHPLSR